MKKSTGAPAGDVVKAKHQKTLLCLLFVIVVSWLTYFFNFDNPNRFIWDERYHVVTAQKYLNNTFYMTTHPPLGKMLLALGQRLYDPDARNDHFVDVHQAQGRIPDDLDLHGYRLMSALLGWLTAPMLFFVFFFLVRSPVTSMFLSFLYIFENALIVHLRAAMLEGPLVFFSVLTILTFILLIEWRDRKKPFLLLSFLFGAALACAVATKILALIFILLIPAALYRLYPKRFQCLQFLFLALIGLTVSYLAIWQAHISIVTNVNPEGNKNGGYYSASEEYKRELDAGNASSTILFAIRHNMGNMRKSGVTSVDLCKIYERGSPPVYWPFGARSIMYLSDRGSEENSQYLYLQANPAVWFLGLLGVVVSVAYVFCALLFWQERKYSKLFYIITFLSLYVGYMVAVSTIDRVMYLYHYFIPLIISFILFGLVFMEIHSLGPWKLTKSAKNTVLAILAACVFLSFQMYRPLTYLEPISDAAMQRRAFFPLWELRCTGCERERLWATPTTMPRKWKNGRPHRQEADL